MAELDGRIALITGASRGIGRATALELAAAGAAIGVNYRSDADGRRRGRRRDRGGRRDARWRCRPTSPSPRRPPRWSRAARTSSGEIDALVCNAGITRDNLIARISPEDFDAVIATNLGGAFHVCQAARRRMLRRRRGSIVTMSSIVGIHGNAGQTNYSASKAGLIGLTKSLAKEIGSRGVRVNCIAPGLHLDRADRRAARAARARRCWPRRRSGGLVSPRTSLAAYASCSRTRPAS